MNQLFTFHATVRGHSHVMNKLPCEDSSSSFSSEDNKYHIAIIADGHGSKSCFRSAYGSKLATEVTLECLQQFAEATLVSEEIEERFYKDLFSNSRYRHMTMRRLTDTILAEWHNRVLEDYKNNPLTIEEMTKCKNEYQNEKKISHIYGTTLIAALKLPKCMLLFQQGDGRCDVLYDDGFVDQPIPWDSRCEGTSTTSLCDEDAAESFRNCVINLSEKPVIACYVGCDGVEDAYRDTYGSHGGSHSLMGGVHTFYKYLTCQIHDIGQEKFKTWLSDFLTEFSAKGIFSRCGSGDDISVSGIVDLDRIGLFKEIYSYDISLYDLEEALFWKEDELRGKTRKHGILKKRLEDAQLILDDALANLKTCTDSFTQLQVYHDELAEKVESAKEELEEYRQDAEVATAQIKGRYAARFASAMQHFVEEISSGYSQKEADYSKMLEQLTELEREIKQKEEEIVGCKNNILGFEKKRDDAKGTFEEYDSKYQSIQLELDQLKEQIAELNEWK